MSLVRDNLWHFRDAIAGDRRGKFHKLQKLVIGEATDLLNSGHYAASAKLLTEAKDSFAVSGDWLVIGGRKDYCRFLLKASLELHQLYESVLADSPTVSDELREMEFLAEEWLDEAVRLARSAPSREGLERFRFEHAEMSLRIIRSKTRQARLDQAVGLIQSNAYDAAVRKLEEAISSLEPSGDWLSLGGGKDSVWFLLQAAQKVHSQAKRVPTETIAVLEALVAEWYETAIELVRNAPQKSGVEAVRVGDAQITRLEARRRRMEALWDLSHDGSETQSYYFETGKDALATAINLESPLHRAKAWRQIGLLLASAARKTAGRYPFHSLQVNSLSCLKQAEFEISQHIWPEPPDLRYYYDKYSFANLQAALERLELTDREPLLKFIRELLSNLGGGYQQTGRVGQAGYLFEYAQETAEVLGEAREAVKLILNQANVDQDHRLQLAVRRYEAVAGLLMANSNARTELQWKNSDDRHLAEGLFVMARINQRQEQDLSSRYWAKMSIELVANDRHPAADKIRQRASRLLGAISKDPTPQTLLLPSPLHETSDEFEEPSEGERPRLAIDELTDFAFQALRDENMKRLLITLDRISEKLWPLAHKGGSLSDEEAARLERLTAQVSSWCNANLQDSAIFPDFGLPLDSSSSAMIAVDQLRIVLASRFSKGQVAIIGYWLGRKLARLGDVISSERVLKYWVSSMTKAAELGDWRQAALSGFEVARAHYRAGKLKDSIRLARHTLGLLANNQAQIHYTYDRIDALVSDARIATRIAKVLVKACADPRLVLNALEAGNGHALAWTRAALLEDEKQRQDYLKEFDLYLEEKSLVQRIRVEKSRGLASQLAKVQRELIHVRGLRIKEALNAIPHKIPPRVDPGQARTPGITPTDYASELEAAVRNSHLGPVTVIEFAKTRSEIFGLGIQLNSNGHSKSRAVILGDCSSGDKYAREALEDLELPLINDDLSRSGLRKAYDFFLAPLEQILEGSKRVYFLPSGELANVPYHALIDHDDQYLIEKFSVGYAPNAKVLSQLLQAHRSGIQVIALGWDEDIKAPQELELIRETLTRIDGLTINIREEEIFGLLDLQINPGRQWAIVHVAAHGEFKSGFDSLKSYLRFKETRLSAEDWLTKGPKSQLIVLNCCDVGQTSSHSGDLFGFPFALLAAGGSSGIVAAAPVLPDDALAFSQAFYPLLTGENLPKIDVFSKAIRTLIGHGKWERPARWASYYFVGDGRPMLWPKKSSERAVSKLSQRPVASRNPRTARSAHQRSRSSRRTGRNDPS